jgi:hypothetical protein
VTEETAMRKAEMLKKKIDQLPLSMLGEVEQLIKELQNRKQPQTILSTLAECAIDDDLPPDFAKHHDHYLYGVPKK